MAEPNPLDNVDPLIVLRLFEADVTHRRYQQAEECLLWLLENSSIFPLHQNKVFPPTYNDREVTYVATRLAAGLCQMFADPAFGIQDKDYYKWAILHENMVAILGVSGFGNADHVIQNLLEPIESRKVEEVTRQAFNKILLLHDSDSEVKIPYEDYLPSHPKHILWMMILAVGKLFCVTEKENAARNKLIEMIIDRIDINAFDQTMLGWISVAWMHCSYATTPLRNKVKKTFNRVLVAWMESIGIKQDQSVAPVTRNGKPVLLVINEFFKVGHAMYRCYAPTIDALREHFYVVGMTAKRHCDDESIKHFDEHHYIDWSDDVALSVRGFIDKVHNIKPHAVYYPSIGMNIYAIIMANIRLSPVSLMSLGHPASSHSDAIDFCLVEDQFISDSFGFSEKLFYLDNNASTFVPHVRQPARSELLRWKEPRVPGEPVRVIITGSSMKINAGFISVLEEISNRTKREVEYHFMPNLNNISISLFRRKIAQKLNRFVVHQPMDYPQYLRKVAHCHIHLSPFPFGSTNSLVDSMLLGLPLVVMRVRESELQIDAGIIEKLNIDALRPAESVEEYIVTACRLIDDDEERGRLTALLEEKDIEQTFFGDSTNALERSARGILELVLHHSCAQSKDNPLVSELCQTGQSK